MSRLEILMSIVNELSELSRLRIDALNFRRTFSEPVSSAGTYAAHAQRLELLRKELKEVEAKQL